MIIQWTMQATFVLESSDNISDMVLLKGLMERQGEVLLFHDSVGREVFAQLQDVTIQRKVQVQSERGY